MKTFVVIAAIVALASAAVLPYKGAKTTSTAKATPTYKASYGVKPTPTRMPACDRRCAPSKEDLVCGASKFAGQNGVRVACSSRLKYLS